MGFSRLDMVDEVGDGLFGAVGSNLTGLIILAEQLNVNRVFSYSDYGEEEAVHGGGGGGFDLECVVCLCGFRNGEQVRRLGCRHLFHKVCLDGWFDQVNWSCPLCRFPLVSDEHVAAIESTTGALEVAYKQAFGKAVSLFEQQLVDYAGAFNNFGCHGGLPSQAFEYIKYNGGLDTEEAYPYTTIDGVCKYTFENVGVKVFDSVNITQNEDEDHEDDDDEDDNEDDFEFVVVGKDSDFSPVLADKIFDNGQIRPVFLIFNRALLFADGAESDFKPNDNPPCSSSFKDELEGIRTEFLVMQTEICNI
ncbi:hypothetical protein NE237_019691 [Protea cynaroides]|uniref:RING-type domain-containing protein n=1 Tax=Protea cynaroides TaxID=273540 RepID=A0A9Q0H4L1_9MAGN|nr:hypothetical protein NE237_019691 [Protea cynaroides]